MLRRASEGRVLNEYVNLSSPSFMVSLLVPYVRSMPLCALQRPKNEVNRMHRS